MQDLAPIVLFTYNRPWHTRQVLNSLALNKEAERSILYIYCDGPKVGANSETLCKIKETRTIVKNENRFKKVIVIEQESNLGLSNSIIKGVTEVVNRHGCVIVLEDDIVPSRGFLKYINESLALYSDDDRVGCIHAWNYNLDNSNYTESTFFLKGADCWGWATWKRTWALFEQDGAKLMNEIIRNKKQYEFNRRGTHKFIEMLQDQIDGKNDSWAIRWHASLFIHERYCLQPSRAIVKNIGLDNTGIHCGISSQHQDPVDSISIRKIKVEESEWFFKAYADFIKKNGRDEHQRKNERNIRAVLKKYTPDLVLKLLRSFRNKPKGKSVWTGKYDSWEEASSHCTGYDSEIILERCLASLLKVKKNEVAFERDSVLFDKIEYNWNVLAGLQCAAMENEGKLCVLDFGGSLGSSYFQNRSFLDTLSSVEWSIIEQSHFVDCGKKHFADERLKFYYTAEECLNEHQPTVLLLSSVLQYLEDPYGWIAKFINLGIKYIIIDRTAFIDMVNDMLSIQHVPENIYDASLPHWFFSEKKFFDQFTGKYELLVKTVSSLQFNFENSRSLFIIFRKI